MAIFAEKLEHLIGMAGGLPAEQRRTLVGELTQLQSSNLGINEKERETLVGVIGRITSLSERLTAIAFGETISEKELIALLREGRRGEFLAAFAKLAGLTPDGAQRALAEDCGAALAAICKAAGFERSTYSAIVLLSDPLHARDPRKTHELLRLYDAQASKAA